jgi:hypothetical protein
MKDLSVRSELSNYEFPKQVNRNKNYQSLDEILIPLFDDNGIHALEDLPNWLPITNLINLNVSQIDTLKKIIAGHNNEILNNNNLINFINKENYFNIGKEIYIAVIEDHFDEKNYGKPAIYKAKIIDKGRLRRCPWQDTVEENGIKYIEDDNRFKLKLELNIFNSVTDLIIDFESFGRDIINPEKYYEGYEVKYPFFIPKHYDFDEFNGAMIFSTLNDAKHYLQNAINDDIDRCENIIKIQEDTIKNKKKELEDMKNQKIDIK